MVVTRSQKRYAPAAPAAVEMVQTRSKMRSMDASESLPAPVVKRPKVTRASPVSAKVTAIWQYIKDNAQDFKSQEVQHMCMASLPYVLGEDSASDQRCPELKTMVTMIEELLTASVDKYESVAKDATSDLASAEKDDEDLANSFQDAEAKSDVQSQKIGEAQESLKAATEAEQEADAAWTKSKNELTEFDAIKAKAANDKTKCEKMRDSFNLVKESEEKDHGIGILFAYLKDEANAEKSMIASGKHVLGKKKDKRSGFDLVVLGALAQTLESHLVELESRAAMSKDSVIETEDSAKKQFVSAAATRAACAKDLEQAEETLVDCQSQVQAALTAVNKQKDLVKRLKHQRDVAMRQQQKAQQVLSSFAWLRDRKSTDQEEEE